MSCTASGGRAASFTELGDRLVVVTQHRWWRNLRGGVDLEVTRFGRFRRMHADLVADTAVVAEIVDQARHRFGANGVERKMGIVLGTDPVPDRSELIDAVRWFDLAAVVLTSVSEPSFCVRQIPAIGSVSVIPGP